MQAEVSDMTFRMQLASLPDGAGSCEVLSFASVRRPAHGAARPFDPVLAATVGAQSESGNLFAYLFRRFGYPNEPWDRRNELARYLLSTRRADLFLGVAPRLDGRADLSLVFLGPAGLGQAARSFCSAPVEAWEGRAIAHGAPRDWPGWLGPASAASRASTDPPGNPADGPARRLREALRPRPGDPPSVALRKRRYLQRCHELYARVEPAPRPLQRPAALKDWSDADPLKPYALAATQALRELKRDVRLGDGAIDVFGARAPTRRALAGAESADLSWNALVPQNAPLVAELQRALVRLGRGDARLGVARALALLQREPGRASR